MLATFCPPLDYVNVLILKFNIKVLVCIHLQVLIIETYNFELLWFEIIA